MSSISDIIQFYKECYAYDVRSLSIKNFFGRSAQNIILIEQLHLLKDANWQNLVSTTWSEKVLKELSIHGKEKALYCGAIFLLGKAKQLGRNIRVAPPLYLYEVFLEEQFGKHRISIDVNSPIINPYFLEYLKNQYPELDLGYEEFAAGFPSGTLGIAEIIQIQTWFDKIVPSLDTSALDHWYEKIEKVENARFIYKQNLQADQNRLIAGVCIGLLRKQEASLGIINELNLLSQRKDVHLSNLARIFHGNNGQKKNPSYQTIEVPFTISQNQEEVIRKADTYHLSVVIGPPGTGKSYTIAALATHLISKGESVLIASKNSQAGKVVVDKIEHDGGIKGIVIKASRKSYKKHLANKMENILSGIQPGSVFNPSKLAALEKELARIRADITHWTDELRSRESEEAKWGAFYARRKNGFFTKYKEKWISYQQRNALKIWKIYNDINHLKKKKHLLLRRLIKLRYENKLAATLHSSRKDILHFSKSLKAERGLEIEEQFQKTNFHSILKALPAWVINAGDVHHILPLEKEIFDVLVIDEATQCDIASCLPLIYRAKRTVIIGDPKQLRHLSFLSKLREKLLNEKYGIKGWEYRDYSILDLIKDRVSTQDQLTFLNEHYRSLPDIIDFSNHKFYNRSLYLMTETPVTRLHKNLFHINAQGKRSSTGINESEADAIIEKMKSIIEHEVKIPRQLSSSIGVVSPFRAQVNYLKSKIRNELSLDEIKKHDVLIGTPFHFQGEEREIMLLSFVIDPTTSPSSFHYLNRHDVFNVSVTRARSLQIIYTSVTATDLNEEMLLREYIAHIEGARTPKNRDNNLSLDEFLKSVSSTIENWKVDRIYESYPISGVIIDLVVVHESKTFCIDLVGYPGLFEKMFDDHQLDRLARMGHELFFIPYSEWHMNREQTIDSLYQFIFS